MVSFQCDGCTDVVKKPKLDQHHSRGCRASFTCIDCSKTFATSSDWKGHTSCISESEKYQKSLYKPRANGGGRDHRKEFATGKFQARGSSGGRPHLGRPPWQVTGANGTPLGTPMRMSPVTITPPREEDREPANSATSKAAETAATVKEKEKKSHNKRKRDNENTTSVQATEVDVSEGQKASKDRKDKKDKKDKKAKKEEKHNHKEAAAADTQATTAGEPRDAISPSSSLAISGDTTKKSKKDRHKHKTDQVVAAPVEPNDTVILATTTGKDDGGKKKKQKKAESTLTKPAAALEQVGIDVSADMAITTQSGENKKTKKRKREAEAAEDPKTRDGDAVNGKKRDKRKKVSAT